jgi:hypothetical protein
MQSYSMHLDRDTITPAHRDGGFFDALSTYSLLNMNSVLNIWADSMHNRGLIIEREKVLRAAYGQRSTYQTEVSNPSAQRPGYGYTTRGGNSYSESWQSSSSNKDVERCLINIYVQLTQINISNSD